LTYKIEDQKIDLGPVVLAFQKEVLWNYLALRTEVSMGFLLVAMFAKTPILLGLANVFPRHERNGRCRVVFLDSSAPKFPDYSVDFTYHSIRK